MAQKTNVRERLLTSALDALHKNGFNATGVQDITDAAKVPKGSFYNHFDSKDALGVEVVGHYVAKGAERRQALVDGPGAPLARLKAYFKSLNQLGPASGFSRGCLLGNFSAELASQSPDIRQALAGALADWTKDIARVVAEAQQAGDIGRDVPAATLAAFLLNAWEGAVLRSRVDRSAVPLDAFMSVAFNKILT
ncbi:TetR/AcrR family transcriptional regulator [Reyranella sp.]|jgi:TetR/AcrR family transcriptional repressor of nem operon|uniref:TetR/AcrR family transcriptional regulator n=1 Tax=Reyranella sp. TaxID=1929291 RepID=UPI0026091379|nr:TetR/AcrR family transcriptional regulator [Reyranella sp.]HQS17416.1 TetR family transcriptional regulator C-terminal domain-containing protein [Reyranella sp.]HQT13857.1 TetR family transcriptional regulator C-terminal domain-containing protein [Reyranella sp.]